MKKYINTTVRFALIIGLVIVGACKSESDPEAPSLTLESTTLKAKAGENVSVKVNYENPEGFEKLVIDKKIDGQVISSETVTEDGSGSYTFSYLVLVTDADGILSFTFTLFDKAGLSTSVDLVIEVELTTEQILTRYDWLLSQEIRKKTNENDITDAYTDDVYRFHEDGKYDKSIGDKADSFGDAWFNHCYYNLSDNILIMTKTGAFGEDVRDTLTITTINADELKADVVYYGLDAFNTGEEAVPYESREEYTKIFSAQAKGSNFDPYGPGSEDDAGPAGTCNEVTFE